MSNALANWSSRVTISARIAERLRSPSADEATPAGDYHKPFGKTEAKTKAENWLWQAIII
jgi:hypothetical protein